MTKPSANSERLAVVRGIDLVVGQHRTIDWVLSKYPQIMDSGFSQALLYGTLRYYFSLNKLVQQHLDKPLRRKDHNLHCILLVGAYQLQHTDIPAYAAINETVDVAKSVGKPWAKGLINALLKKIAGLEKPDRSFDHPLWLCKRLRRQYPQQWLDVVRANQQRAPMTLRINVIKTSSQDYRAALSSVSINYRRGFLDETVILEQAQPSTSLPGWQAGWVAVQDQGAQWVSHLLAEQVTPSNIPAAETLRILDACAAPGGKLQHLHERLQHQKVSAHLDAIELNAERIRETQRISTRLGHHLSIQAADASDAQWWDGTPYDAILLDAPCSGTGTIRRHPDIKLLLKPADIERHATRQLSLLNNLWRMLSGGGTLLYCTCSILKEENDQVIEQFLATQPDAISTPTAALPSGQATRYGWQLLPTDADTDGFYLALLTQRSKA